MKEVMEILKENLSASKTKLSGYSERACPQSLSASSYSFLAESTRMARWRLETKYLSRREEQVRSPWKVVWLKKESSLGRCVSLGEPSLRGEV